MDSLLNTVGCAWLAAALTTVLSALVTVLLDSEPEPEVDTAVDRAFDRNKLNCYQEAVGLALTLLPPLAHYLQLLSPRVLLAALTEPLPAPELWPSCWSTWRRGPPPQTSPPPSWPRAGESLH